MKSITTPSCRAYFHYSLILVFTLLMPAAAFGQQYINLPLALYIENRYISEIPAVISETDQDITVKIESSQFLSDLKPFLSDEAFTQIDMQVEGQWLTTEQIEQKGLAAAFDSSQLIIRILIPPEKKPPNIVALRQERPHPAQRDLSAAPFSAYVNMNTTTEAVYDESGDKTELSLPLSVYLSPTINVYRWVLEAGAQFNTHTQKAAELDYVQLVHDYPQNGIRLAAGTLNTPTEGGLISSIPIDGVTIGTLPVLKEAFSNYTPSSRTLLLEQPATVSIYLNGRLLKQLKLDSGVHKLTDFPYIGGLNEIRITVTPQDGEERTIHSFVPFDSRLLKPGEWNFYFAGGTPQHTFSHPIASGIVQYGLTSGISTGVQFQTSQNNYIGAAHSLFATPLGNIELRAGLSGGVDRRVDYSGRVQYRIFFPSKQNLPSFGAFYHYTGKNYISSAVNPLAPEYSSQFGGTISQKLPLDSYLSLSSSYKIGHQSNRNMLNGSFTLLKSLGSRGSFSLSFNLDHSEYNGIEWQGSVAFSFSSPDSRKNLLFSQDLKTGAAGTSYNYSSSNDRSPDYSMSLEGMPPGTRDSSRVQAAAAYSNNYFNTSLSHSFAVSQSDTTASTNARSARLNWNFSSAILYIPGHIAITQPVQDSFLMVVPDSEIDELLLTAGINRGSAEPLETRGGTMSFNSITSYAPTTINIDLPLSPPETVLQADQITLFPSYRSGTIITARLRRSVYLEGGLRSQNDEELSLQTGQIIRKDADDPKPILFFTDEKGDFQIHDVEPGIYTLRLFAYDNAEIEIEIPTEADNPHQLHTLTMPVLQK